MIEPDRQTATVEVKYYAYSPASPIETAVHETQQWYREAGVGNNWHVRSSFRGLDAILAQQ